MLKNSQAWALSLIVLLLLNAGCAARRTPPPAANPVATPTPAAAVVPTTPATPGTTVLFDGKTLKGWESSDFAGRGTVTIENGVIKLGLGHMTGITLTNTNELPRMNYEISLDAMRTDGSDFFCGLTFPVGNEPCSLIVGGWGGGTVGLSSVDGEDASQNETTSYMNFTNGKWFHIRVRVEPGKIQAWIDEDRVVNLDTTDKRFSIRLEVEPSVPLGIATWNTAAALKNIQLKKL
ncbi:MAG TPA: DUF1080 domain-containing protein [Candidatus Limnocylindria bacterium]|nr:DUF1080 domain-containing protein [Candidatus Limnocylindria bacterium]